MLAGVLMGRGETRGKFLGNFLSHKSILKRLQAILSCRALAGFLDRTGDGRLDGVVQLPLLAFQPLQGLFGLFREVVQQTGIALLTATHDAAVYNVADRVLHISDGRWAR